MSIFGAEYESYAKEGFDAESHSQQLVPDNENYATEVATQIAKLSFSADHLEKCIKTHVYQSNIYNGQITLHCSEFHSSIAAIATLEGRQLALRSSMANLSAARDE